MHLNIYHSNNYECRNASSGTGGVPRYSRGSSPLCRHQSGMLELNVATKMSAVRLLSFLGFSSCHLVQPYDIREDCGAQLA